MEDKAKIQCSCGQENQLVLVDGTWRYDAERHGNGEPCNGRCFNCGAALVDDTIFPPAEPAPEPEPSGEEQEELVARPSMDMKKDELLAIAADLVIEVPKNATKAQILEMIEQADKEEPGEDEPDGE